MQGARSDHDLFRDYLILASISREPTEILSGLSGLSGSARYTLTHRRYSCRRTQLARRVGDRNQAFVHFVCAFNSGISMIETHFGGCACRAVRYRVRGKPVLGTVCHCRFCQKRLASAFAMLASFKEDTVDILQSGQSEIEYRSDESGRWLRMSFCPKCGTFDNPTWFSIERHISVQSKLPWVAIPPDVAAYTQGFIAQAS